MVLIVAALADTRSFAEEVAFLGLRGDHLISACHINSCSTADRVLLKKEKQETTSAIEFSVFDFLCVISPGLPGEECQPGASRGSQDESQVPLHDHETWWPRVPHEDAT